MPGDHLQRLPVPLIHGKEKQRQHEHHHAHGGKADIGCRFLDQEESGYADQRRRAETQELAFRQIENDFGFDPREIPRDRDIHSHFFSYLPSSVRRKHASGKASRFEQGKTQQYRVPHHAPDGGDDVVAEGYCLHQYRIDADTDHDEESLEPEGKERPEIVLPDLALLPVAEGCERDWRKAGHQIDFHHTPIDDYEDHYRQDHGA